MKIAWLLLSLCWLVQMGEGCLGQRCCLSSPCTQTYCNQKNSQTWVPSQPLATYQYTKLTNVNASCLPCAYSCQNCDSLTVCTSCAKGFYMASARCQMCGYNCLNCNMTNGQLKCFNCKAGTYLEQGSATCRDCPSGAMQCTSQTVVTQCNSGFMLTSNFLYCVACPANCLSCNTSASVCSKCRTGYYLNVSTCFACTVPNCLNCFQSTSICSQCLANYRLSGGMCVPCPAKCVTCTATACTLCDLTTILVNGSCLLITTLIPNCNKYSTSNTCSQCALNYYLRNNSCASCSILCLNCTGSHFGACQTCISTATLFNQMCLAFNFLTLTSYQIYYSLIHMGIPSLLNTLDCNTFLVFGSTIAFAVNNLGGYSVAFTFKAYTLQPQSTLNIAFINSINASLSYTSIATSELRCDGIPYYLVLNTATFTSVQVNNTLQLSAATTIAVQQILAIIRICHTLCIQCSETKCSLCSSALLYTEQADCVYSCSIGYNAYNVTNACLQICPLTTYSYGGVCEPCVSPCLTCTSLTQCIICSSTFYLTLSGQCLTVCPYRYYPDALSQTCQACVGRCRECTSATVCLSCASGFFQNSACVDECVTASTFASLSTLTCVPCDSNCLSCQYTDTHCTACYPNYYLFNDQCLSACPKGYYSSVSWCLPCSYPCAECVLTATSCLTCLINYVFNSSCIVSCPLGYYEDGALCALCSSGCANCYSSTLCLACLPSYILFETQCLTQCPIGLYSFNGTCIQCSSPCFTCLNDTYCLSCREQFLLGSECVDSSVCIAGTYAQISNLKCSPCAPSCLTCKYSALSCTSCTNSLLQNGVCVSQCLNTAFYGANGVCIPCVFPCRNCTNATACLSCVSGYFLSNTLCSGTCAPGFYLSLNACQSCLLHCTACVQSNVCQQCATSYFLLQWGNGSMECVSPCPDNFYADVLSYTCQSCIYPCLKCSSVVDCTSCQTGILYQARCTSDCPDSTYQSQAQCLLCMSPCGSCISATLCLTCVPSFFLDPNGSCVAVCSQGTYIEAGAMDCILCPSTCGQCINATYCTVCLPNSTFLLDGDCLFACPGTYYASVSGNCSRCKQECGLCTESSCLTCSATYLAYQSNTLHCVLVCPTASYASDSSCVSCVFPCSTCTSLTNCLTCYFGMYFLPTVQSCVSHCPAQTYADATVCTNCTLPCVTCRNATVCFSCTNNTFLLSNQCVAMCPVKYYNASGQCVACASLCATCLVQFLCTSCVVGYLSNGFCYMSCPAGQYQTNSSCLPCVPPCLQCILSASYCTLCTGSLFLYRGSCSPFCPIGSFANANQCLACEFPCVNCSSISQCSQCLGGFLLYNGVQCIANTEFCPNGFYKLDNAACVSRAECPQDHYIDALAMTCTVACALNQYVLSTTKSCLSNCPSALVAGPGLVCTDSPPATPLFLSTISFIRSSILHIVLMFNQSVTWSYFDPSMYSITQNLFSKQRLLRGISLNSRLLSSTEVVSYSLNVKDPTDISLSVAPVATSVILKVPPSSVYATTTKMPLFSTAIMVELPPYTVYDAIDIYRGNLMSAYGSGISWFILLLSVLFLFRNKLSQLYMLWDAVQLLFMLLLLDIQYPPNLNELFLGLQYVVFTFIPFNSSAPRQQSAAPFYAYLYDCSFIRTAAPLLIIVVSIFAFYSVLKILQCVLKRAKSMNAPRTRKIVYTLALRFRWHHISDTIFVTYLPCVTYAVAQLFYPGGVFSMVLALLTLILYIVFPIFVGRKLYRHLPNVRKNKLVKNLRCFYRGIAKESTFGVFLIMIRYFRRLLYGTAIALFSHRPMYALPLLMFSSVLMGLFLLLEMPYMKRLSNVVQVLAEGSLTVLFLLIAIIHVSESASVKVTVGWVCCGVCSLLLLLLLFEVLCMAMFHLESQSRTSPHLTQSQLRLKAAQFFDHIFPQLRREWDLDVSQQRGAEPGDSDDSENYDQGAWGLESHTQDQFRHYQSDSQQTAPKDTLPQYMIRCVKNIAHQSQKI